MRGSVDTRDWRSRQRGLVLAAACVATLGVGYLIAKPFVERSQGIDAPFADALQNGWAVTGTRAGAAVAMADDGRVISVQSPRLTLSADLCPMPRLTAFSEA